MVIDFGKISTEEKPMLILKNLDGVTIQPLGYAFNVSIELLYNELSILTFDIPAYVNNQKTPHYDDVIGMRIIDLMGYGQFILVDPSEEYEDNKKIKSCKAYSLEYEFSKKNIVLENGTYNFWNPLSPEDTIIGRILEKMPDWSIGTIDDNLIGKYRTFEVIEEKIYNFIKSSVQVSYGCIFEFDTYNRTINVVSVSSEVEKTPIYLSSERLIKKIQIEEDSDSIVTCLDVNGAEGVTIRSVNPTGTNKIYNLDYFMNTTNFPKSLIEKWDTWKNSCEFYQKSYYNLTIENNLLTSRLLAEEAVLTDLKNELTNLENLRATTIQSISEGLLKQSDLDSVNKDIDLKNDEISNQQNVIESIKTEKSALTNQLSNINSILSMKGYFSAEELSTLQKYFIEDSLEDDTFVAATSATYNNTDISGSVNDIHLKIKDATITQTSDATSKLMYLIEGGNIVVDSLDSTLVQATVEFNEDNSFVFTAYLERGSINTEEFKSGSISLIGYYKIVTQNTKALDFIINNGTLYFTRNTTDYEQHTIEQELYEYGKQVLNEKSSPTYTFSIDSGNFLYLKDFVSFKNSLKLGRRVYLKLDENAEPITPYLISVKWDFEDPSSFELEFGSTYTSSDKSFRLTKLLEQSVSMGKTLNVKSGVYSEFVNSGASTSVRDFMNSALDIAKNTVLSTGQQAIEFGDAGIRVRKWNDDAHTHYADEQIWIVDNMIAFTTDNWATSKMAIGKIFDDNIINSDGTKGGTTYGIAAPYIVGTLLAGESLMIDTTNGSFKIDETGVYVDSLKFNILHPKPEDDGSATIINRPLEDLLSENGYLDTDAMEGAIKASVNQMVSGSGNVLFDGDGIWLMDNTSKNTCTKAIWMNSEGILFGSGNKCENPADPDSGWTWTTAITHGGVIADNIAAGTLSGMTIKGGSLDIGEGDFTVDSDGNLTANKGTFKGTVQGATFKTKNGTHMMNDDYQFNPDYLSLYGLEIVNEDTGETTFYIDNSGNVSGNNCVFENGVFSGEFQAGSIKADTTIDVNTIATIGQKIILRDKNQETLGWEAAASIQVDTGTMYIQTHNDRIINLSTNGNIELNANDDGQILMTCSTYNNRPGLLVNNKRILVETDYNVLMREIEALENEIASLKSSDIA